VQIDADSVETNIVNIELGERRAEDVVGLAREQNVLINAITPSALRAVTHLDVSDSAGEAARRLAVAIKRAPMRRPEPGA
jgi:threonine aldolase